MSSNAPCLYGLKDGEGVRCYSTVLKGTGYCKIHQKDNSRWKFHSWGGESKKPKNWSLIRRQVLQRDKYICYLCGGYGADSVDHIKPLSKGGTNAPHNLKAVHDNAEPKCHKRKTQEESIEARKLNNTFKRRGSNNRIL